MIRFNDPRLTNIKARLQATQWAQRLTKRAVRTAAPVTTLPAIPTIPALSIETAIPQKTPFTMNPTALSPAVPARFLGPIRLGDAAPVGSAVIERHALAFGDAAVRNLASRCAAALERLVFEGAYAHFASVAIEAAHTDGGTPAALLERMLQTLKAETMAARIERGRHDARVKARADRLQPLKLAVSARLTACEVEGPRLAERIRLAEAAPFGHQSPSAYQRLIEAGLTHAQIKLTGVENPVSQTEKDVQAAKDRIAVLQAELPALRAFSADPLCSPAHLEGLAGFDALVAASQNITEE